MYVSLVTFIITTFWLYVATLNKICSVNCRGLGAFEKQKDVFDSLRTKSYSIYMLQDTHFSKEK